ncbi:DNA-binding response OmpR family regulator [Runella defluvii]|uniref:DNA-binding response OmpR family regulator n=1 Tax=Runella defluvii TaxID=370973 RepID=A0A7W5ZM15_9BACT|nr:response regulator [Runella defluvii]MBB3839902.1 DNA-binding response OmpR family regulator [Runella defluvii]
MDNASLEKVYERALIIDDELDTCLLLGMFLKKYGIVSMRAHSLADGLAKLTAEAPQLIFLDNNLPDGTGIDYIAQVRQQMPQAKLVMMTAMSALREQALALGADGFVEKPLDVKKIASVL